LFKPPLALKIKPTTNNPTMAGLLVFSFHPNTEQKNHDDLHCHPQEDKDENWRFGSIKARRTENTRDENPQRRDREKTEDKEQKNTGNQRKQKPEKRKRPEEEKTNSKSHSKYDLLH
jgi:hypothetical protein